MTDNINHPAHYETGFEPRPLECIDIARHMDFLLGNAFKYVWRAGKKGDAMEDLQKAEWYIQLAEVDNQQPPHWLRNILLNGTQCPESGLEMERWTMLWYILLGDYDLMAEQLNKLMKMFK